MSVTVRPVAAQDVEAWARLYAGYRAFYQLPDDPEAVATTWRWVRNGEHGLFGLVAADDEDRPVALAILRWFARPSTGTVGLYLDDLFTAPEARGSGAAGALLKRAAELAGDGGASVVRWITADDNAAARSVYDVHGVATSWVTYDMQPTTRLREVSRGATLPAPRLRRRPPNGRTNRELRQAAGSCARLRHGLRTRRRSARTAGAIARSAMPSRGGDVELAAHEHRRNLSDAVESTGHRVIGEEPVVAEEVRD